MTPSLRLELHQETPEFHNCLQCGIPETAAKVFQIAGDWYCWHCANELFS